MATEYVLGNVMGPQGPKGDRGDKGDTGSKGDKGEKGDRGDAVYDLGSYSEAVVTTRTVAESRSAVVVKGKTGQSNSAPTPDNPAAITGVGESGKAEVKVCGKNLLLNNLATKTNNGITFTVNADKSITLKGTASGRAQIDFYTHTRIPFLVQGKVYTTTTKTVLPNGVSLHWARDNVSGGWLSNMFPLEGGKSSVTFTMFDPEYGKYAYSLVLQVSAGTVVNNLTIFPQIEEGSTTTAYEPYHEDIVTLPLASPLYSLPNGVRDEWDVEAGTVTRRVGKRVFDGTESFGNAPTETTDTLFAILFPISDANPTKNTLTSRFPTASGLAEIKSKESAGFIYAYAKNKNFYFTISKTRAKDLPSFKNLVVQWFADGRPLTVLYELAQPTIEHISPALLPIFPGDTTTYCTDPLAPDLSLTVLDPRPLSAARSLDGYAKATVEAALPRSGGVMSGQLVAASNTAYSTAQVRNVICSAGAPTGGANGDIWMQYT